jgi:putative LysE/RhtB family amino acid efflux pump
VGAVAVGFGLGFFVALQVGPMSLLLIRSTLRSGILVGLAIAAGIALVDATYAAAGAAGAAGAVQLGALRTTLGLIGAAVLVYLGVQILRAARHPPEATEGPTAPAVPTLPHRAFLTALGATASNPMTIVSWAAVFGAASVATDANVWLLILGVALGSAVWMTSLAGAVAVVRRKASVNVIRAIDVVAGVGMIAFAGVLAYGAVVQ